MSVGTRLIAFIAFISPMIAVNHVHANQSDATLTDEKKAALVHMVKQDCGSCHGMTLKGGLGPALLQENLKDKPILFIQNTILHGRPGTAMPPWKTIITPEEAAWISQQLQQGKINEK